VNIWEHIYCLYMHNFPRSNLCYNMDQYFHFNSFDNCLLLSFSYLNYPPYLSQNILETHLPLLPTRKDKFKDLMIYFSFFYLLQSKVFSSMANMKVLFFIYLITFVNVLALFQMVLLLVIILVLIFVVVLILDFNLERLCLQSLWYLVW